ncbi:hypothetical protein [Methylibium sp.]|uniref:hypothetical protein n=1 Tax=Methylibium sp. TaxID=2067992 RepID=UPI001855EB33|nr:hypothetical protein [Methylibium sp.]MBA3588211.1 hypothetical protein [Methylibium sp.]
MKTPQAGMQRVRQSLGIPEEAAPQLDQYLRGGRIDRYDMGGRQGPVMPAPEWAEKPALDKFGQFFSADQAVQSGSAKSVKDYFDGMGAQAEAGLTGLIASGNIDPTVGATRAYAIKGSAPYNFNEYGVGNNLTGEVDASGGPAVAFGNYRTATTGAQQANARQSDASAVASRASADNSRASAAKTRFEMTDGANGRGQKAPVGYRWSGDALEPIKGGPADPATKGAKLAKPPTEGQAKALMFGSRMTVADEVLKELEATGQRLPNMTKQAAESVPLIGTALGMGANMLGTDGEQQVEQAQRDFINAILRRESGAVIADSEFNNARKQYFAQPGDSPTVLRQKEINRRTAIEGQKAEFGEQSMPQFLDIVRSARSERQKPLPDTPQRKSGTVSREAASPSVDALLEKYK